MDHLVEILAGHAMRPLIGVELDYAVSRMKKALAGLPRVMIHGDANPANIVRSGGGVLGLDFGAAGTGLRVVEVATVAVLATETGTSSLSEIVAAYGAYQDVSPMVLRAAELMVAVARAQACTWVPRLNEGWGRIAALDGSRPYVFGSGGHPK